MSGETKAEHSAALPKFTTADLLLEAIKQGANTPNQGVLVNFD